MFFSFLVNNIVEVAVNLEEQIAARKAASERNKVIFLSEVGPETYLVISNLVAPAKPKDIVLEQIFKKLNSHFNPYVSVGNLRKFSLRKKRSNCWRICE